VLRLALYLPVLLGELALAESGEPRLFEVGIDRGDRQRHQGAENAAELRAQIEILARGQEQLARVVGMIEEHHHGNGQNGLPPAPPDNSMEVA
jgi:hypothetical protein